MIPGVQRKCEVKCGDRPIVPTARREPTAIVIGGERPGLCEREDRSDHPRPPPLPPITLGSW